MRVRCGGKAIGYNAVEAVSLTEITRLYGPLVFCFFGENALKSQRENRQENAAGPQGFSAPDERYLYSPEK